jgi:hypothetical protein
MMPSTIDAPLRIVLVDPPPGVMYCIQRASRTDCVDHKRSGEGDLVFDLVVRVKEGGEQPDFAGPFIQGRRGERHIAILIGTLAGDAESCWTRGVKIRLEAITLHLIAEARSRGNGVLTARFAGRSRDGGPSCATVPAMDGGWRVEYR